MIFPADATATSTTAAVAAAPSTAGSVAQMGFSLVLVLGVIFALAWVLRWLQGPRAAGSAALRLHAGLQVGAKEKVLLIEAGGQHLLIGVSPGGVRTLHVFADPPAMTDAAAATPLPPFAEKLRELLQRGRGA